MFALLDPDKSMLHGYHPKNVAPQQGARVGGSMVQEAGEIAREDMARIQSPSPFGGELCTVRGERPIGRHSQDCAQVGYVVTM